jgi:hypothetical protein
MYQFLVQYNQIERETERETKMELTFGKYKGWKLSELALAGSYGRGYLSWGSNNLDNRSWRKRFAKALEIEGISADLVARAAMVSEPGLTRHDAKNIGACETEDYNREHSARCKMDEAENWLKLELKALTGASERTLENIVRWIVEDGMDELDYQGVQFRSVSREQVADLVAQFQAKMEVIEW